MLNQIRVDRPETDLAAEFKKGAAGAPQRQDVSFDGKSQPQDVSQKIDAVVDAKSVAEAVASIVSFAEGLGRSLAISVDDRSGDFVVRVQNASTEEFVRQIPSEEVLKISAAIKDQVANLDLMGEEGARGLFLEAVV
jgi:flagellar protein FlaG